jgi:hypothetical protein
MSPVKQRLLEAIANAPDSQIEALLAVIETWADRNPSIPESRGSKIAAIFDQLAQLSPSITDPIAWQNEVRQDRSLPGRSE